MGFAIPVPESNLNWFIVSVSNVDNLEWALQVVEDSDDVKMDEESLTMIRLTRAQLDWWKANSGKLCKIRFTDVYFAKGSGLVHCNLTNLLIPAFVFDKI